ncbi:MAG TPA: hypothetical protein VJC07_04220 [Candidatus Nanoarchaeia archaeon]|nr:hypothetical protein [Candidatus Nanoarchaeia archaeon]
MAIPAAMIGLLLLVAGCSGSANETTDDLLENTETSQNEYKSVEDELRGENFEEIESDLQELASK